MIKPITLLFAVILAVLFMAASQVEAIRVPPAKAAASRNSTAESFNSRNETAPIKGKESACIQKGKQCRSVLADCKKKCCNKEVVTKPKGFWCK